uniref:Kielin cysteine rich BMP regulator n=1 Tax=Myotis myotis TaxID=51298 RepID=A0A7J7V3F0_MYOMY|nr:kielin cysteine rich BMP regulator [Myotis myotis]
MPWCRRSPSLPPVCMTCVPVAPAPWLTAASAMPWRPTPATVARQGRRRPGGARRSVWWAAPWTVASCSMSVARPVPAPASTSTSPWGSCLRTV